MSAFDKKICVGFLGVSSVLLVGLDAATLVFDVTVFDNDSNEQHLLTYRAEVPDSVPSSGGTMPMWEYDVLSLSSEVEGQVTVFGVDDLTAAQLRVSLSSASSHEVGVADFPVPSTPFFGDASDLRFLGVTSNFSETGSLPPLVGSVQDLRFIDPGQISGNEGVSLYGFEGSGGAGNEFTALITNAVVIPEASVLASMGPLFLLCLRRRRS